MVTPPFATTADVADRVEVIMETYRTSRATAAEHFGDLSKASYVVTFAALKSLFHVYLEHLDTADRTWIADRFDAVRGELHGMFLRMTLPPRAEIGRTPGVLAGAACELLTFDAEQAETRAGRAALGGSIRPLDEVLRIGVLPATHLYCLTEQDRFVLYAVPLSYRDMMMGAAAAGFTVKHTMLPQDGEAVVCAGEIHLATSPTGVTGAIVTTASGHFQPRVSAGLLARDHLVRRQGMRGDAICLLSRPGEA